METKKTMGLGLFLNRYFKKHALSIKAVDFEDEDFAWDTCLEDFDYDWDKMAAFLLSRIYDKVEFTTTQEKNGNWTTLFEIDGITFGVMSINFLLK